MINNLKINVPVLKNGMLTAHIQATLSEFSHAEGTVAVDFTELLPWASSAKKEVFDFFAISAFVYGIDRFIPRRKNSIDGWTREIDVTLPVYKFGLWSGLSEKLEKLLSFLTGDYWKIKFYKNTLELPKEELGDLYKQNFKQINLFSGGLDSLIGAINSLEGSAYPDLFVSHYDPTMGGPKKDQDVLSPELQKEYKKLFEHLPSVKVFLSQTTFANRETTCRSRSILFLGLAVLIAEPSSKKVIVPENGTVSLNYPLSPSRRSACSTRTTHPTYLEAILELWKELGIDTTISNPYWNKTKGEMVDECKNMAFLQRVINHSNSCGKRGHRAHWEDGHASHCGICMPCIYRQASLQNIPDNTTYGNNINNLVWTKKKGQDVGALLNFLKAGISKNDIKFELISNGLQNHEQISEYVKLIIKSRAELVSWIKTSGNWAVRSKAGL